MADRGDPFWKAWARPGLAATVPTKPEFVNRIWPGQATEICHDIRTMCWRVLLTPRSDAEQTGLRRNVRRLETVSTTFGRRAAVLTFAGDQANSPSPLNDFDLWEPHDRNWWATWLALRPADDATLKAVASFSPCAIVATRAEQLAEDRAVLATVMMLQMKAGRLSRQQTRHGNKVLHLVNTALNDHVRVRRDCT